MNRATTPRPEGAAVPPGARAAAALRGRIAPAGAALVLALPFGMTTAPVTAAPPPAGVPEALAPGVDVRRLVLPDGELAGRSVRVSEVASALEPAEALARVERLWRASDGAAVLRVEHGTWSVVSRQLGDGFETLQLRVSPFGGSEGMLAQWKGSALRSGDDRSLANLLPAEAQVTRQLLSTDRAADGTRSADTLIARLPHGIDESERRVDRHLHRAGFVAMRQPAVRRTFAWRSDRARFYRAAGAELLVTLHAQPQGTGVVVYHVRLPR
ncbi:MAG: hypothetical protein KJ011_09245 [Burkholderiaceae bacterium]|nr:hypothetical protein [Burkholderiaceae bacterium]